MRHGRLRRDLQGNLLERLDMLDLLDERQQHVEPRRERPAKLAKALDDPRLLLGHKLDDLCVCVCVMGYAVRGISSSSIRCWLAKSGHVEPNQTQNASSL